MNFKHSITEMGFLAIHSLIMIMILRTSGINDKEELYSIGWILIGCVMILFMMELIFLFKEIYESIKC